MTKINSRLLSLIIVPLLLSSFSSQRAKAQDASVSYQSDGVSYQTFYDQMAPYGQWVNDPQYGNVWVPNAEPGFRPYATDGHWVMTDQGNMWVSDQPWAWAAYHYGRWTYNPYYGWVWIPGYEWAPAWVSWRSGGGYYGWAPMGPGNVYGGVYEYPSNYWVFVTPGYLYNPYVYNYYPRGDAGVYIQQTNYITYQSNGPRYYGPRREEVERVTGQPVQVYRVSNAGSAGAGRVGGNEVNIYRPAINRESANTARPANVVPGGGHPIGRPEPMSADHATAQPAFRQEHAQPQEQQHSAQPQQQRGQPEQQRQQFQEQPRQQSAQPQQQQHSQPEQQRQQYQQQPRQQGSQQQQQRQPAQQQRQPQSQQRGGGQQKSQQKQQARPKQEQEHR